MTYANPAFLCYLSVLSPGYDCTNGGVSGGGQKRLALYRADAKPETIANVEPAVKVSTNALGQPIIVPFHGGPVGAIGPMFGGNYATGDSRLGQEIERVTGRRFYGALCIHDRFETPALYRSLTAGD